MQYIVLPVHFLLNVGSSSACSNVVRIKVSNSNDLVEVIASFNSESENTSERLGKSSACSIYSVS